MAASASDLFSKLSRKWVGQVGAGGVADASVTTIPLASTTNLATDTGVIVVIDRVDANGTKTPTSEETVIGVVSGSSLTSVTRGIEGTAQAHAAGAVVEILVTAKGWNNMVDGIILEHLQTGRHGDVCATSLTTTGNIDLTSTKGIRDANDNELLTFIQTTSAVNELTLKNAATGNAPDLCATGGDTNIGIRLVPKGSGDINLAPSAAATTVNIQVNGADPKRGIYVPASAMFPSTTAGCAALTQVESSTNKVNIKVLDFDGAGTSKEYAEFGIPSPYYWTGGTVTAKFVWYATAGSGTVNWEIQGGSFADDDALDQAYGTLQEVTDTLLATGDIHITAATPALTIAGSPTGGDWINFRIARDPANDTNTSDARLVGCIITFDVGKYSDE